MNTLTLATVRESLIRQEDTIVFSLIERSKYTINSQAYSNTNNNNQSHCSSAFPESFAVYFIKETEALHSKVGRYVSPEEHPFFPDNLPPPLVQPHSYPPVLHPAAASINMNKSIWDVYYNQLLPLFVAEGDDGNYALSAASDLNCLQAISRRIHFGKFVAEVKFRDSPGEYEPAIRAKDRDALMKILTFERVEEQVKKRVGKKAAVFGKDVKLVDDGSDNKYKIDPSIASRLYEEWIIPMTKLVQVEYLLRRLD